MPDPFRVVELCGSLPLLANDDNAHTSAFKSAPSKETDAAVSSWTEVDSVGRTRGEVTSFHPVDGLNENLITEGSGKRGREIAKIGACYY